MTLTELIDGLTALYPTRYSHFAKKQNAPFICWLDEGDNPLIADNKVINTSTAIRIELYTKVKDFEAENKIKKLLNDNDIPYEKDQTFYIETEGLFLCVFDVEIIDY